MDRLDRGGFLSALASRPVLVSEGELSSILLSSEDTRANPSLAPVSGSGIQSSL